MNYAEKPKYGNVREWLASHSSPRFSFIIASAIDYHAMSSILIMCAIFRTNTSWTSHTSNTSSIANNTGLSSPIAHLLSSGSSNTIAALESLLLLAEGLILFLELSSLMFILNPISLLLTAGKTHNRKLSARVSNRASVLNFLCSRVPPYRDNMSLWVAFHVVDVAKISSQKRTKLLCRLHLCFYLVERAITLVHILNSFTAATKQSYCCLLISSDYLCWYLQQANTTIILNFSAYYHCAETCARSKSRSECIPC